MHPFVDRKVPIITDAILVDPKFGTGAVKVTPAHDFNDFATGKRHNLEEINILNARRHAQRRRPARSQGSTASRAHRGEEGARRRRASRAAAKPHLLTLPKCQRSGDIVEPMISTQWFCEMKAMAEAAIKAVRDGRTEDHPGGVDEDLRPLARATSRTGASRVSSGGVTRSPPGTARSGEITCREPHEACADRCGSSGLQADPDVLDTWFSSGLWPFSTLGWPNDTPDLKKFYPTSDLETGYDILFFWVARMMMFGLHFMREVALQAHPA